MAKVKKRIEIRISDRVILYLRVSTDEQARDAYGLESQEFTCREFCAMRGWTIIQVFRDEGVSAWSDVKRPGFLQMMQVIAAIRNVNLVFFDYSRFGRHTRRALSAFERIDGMGIFSIAAMSPHIDCRTAQGRYARRDALSKAEDFSDQHSENQQARMKAALEAGRWLGKAPLGFINVRAKKGEPNITPVEPAISLVRQSFELFQTGTDRPTALLRKMSALGLRSRTDKEMTVDQFIRMLKSVAYTGQVPSKKYGPRLDCTSAS